MTITSFKLGIDCSGAFFKDIIIQFLSHTFIFLLAFIEEVGRLADKILFLVAKALAPILVDPLINTILYKANTDQYCIKYTLQSRFAFSKLPFSLLSFMYILNKSVKMSCFADFVLMSIYCNCAPEILTILSDQLQFCTSHNPLLLKP